MGQLILTMRAQDAGTVSCLCACCPTIWHSAAHKGMQTVTGYFEVLEGTALLATPLTSTHHMIAVANADVPTQQASGVEDLCKDGQLLVIGRQELPCRLAGVLCLRCRT